MIYQPLTDRKFTWFRGHSCSCIDRALVSVKWLEVFSETRLKGGPRSLSDHCPVIVKDNMQRGGPKSFRSLDSWFTHDGFLRMVNEERKGLGEMHFTDKLKALTAPLGRWHKVNFSEMDKKISKFEDEIKRIDDMVGSGVYDGTIEARRKALVTCCEKWYVRKKVHWKQRSRSQQAMNMDKNTRSFHNVALARRRNNMIDALEVSPLVGFRDGLVERIDEVDSVNLEAMPSTEEIREAVWDCETSKAPGCDGYNTNFIKRCWDEIESEFTTAVMGFFQTSRLPADTNITWVALAPKFIGAKEIKDLRSISIVGCVYKLKLRKKEAAIIKLDFQKAYDRVKWSFVDIVLQQMWFGSRWREWVMECVTTTSMSILINRSPSKPFKMERGLRQGDPLSPFLFVLVVVDVLHKMVGKAVRNGCISPLVVGRDSIELSHLHFADDTILFSPSEEETVKNYKRLLRCFELMSGLSINFDKFSLIPINCEGQWVDRICSLFKPIIDKVEEKLSLWKAKVLSKAGKLVLIKAMLNSLSVYYLSLYKMPKAVAEKLISLQRNFFWSKVDGMNGIALVKWEVVWAPKKLGGLRVGDAIVRNTALLFKWWWRFAKEECPLWKRVVCSCNNLNPNELLSTQVLPTRGGPWKDICQIQIKEQLIRDKMITGLSMEVGDGRRTPFWEDVWLQCGSLKDRFPRLFSVSNQYGLVLHEDLLPKEISSYNFTKTIWKGVVPPRVELFTWFILVGRVNTKERLSRFGILSQKDNGCIFCNKDVEQVHHLFLGCEFAWQWQRDDDVSDTLRCLEERRRNPQQLDGNVNFQLRATCFSLDDDDNPAATVRGRREKPR
ncbi:uncharacterized protein LOC107488571 [Arachis duranensis]|uniref:Uncharacterized protein LOC107488571 n=1 Tax=Arachis duranensis TaxID=130453 RepID=A0A6P4DCN5_ARADU|nr:uncharacterized protein LOC107488571 [Arachis duranensis]